MIMKQIFPKLYSDYGVNLNDYKIDIYIQIMV